MSSLPEEDENMVVVFRPAETKFKDGLCGQDYNYAYDFDCKSSKRYIEDGIEVISDHPVFKPNCIVLE